MKNHFEWYFQPTDEEIKIIWKKAILTVDTNVLLDLYRYHEDTRKNIIDALKKFKCNIWISHQVATEFFKNRMKVIINSKNSIEKVEKSIHDFQIAELSKLIKILKENRMIPSKDIEKFENNFSKQFEDLICTISSLKEKYPDFKNNDDILKELLEIINSNIGEPFNQDDLKKEEKIASDRFAKKIPPGYIDAKDKDYPYGDYFVWRQIIDYSKSKNLPVILITSEKKEDWWEIHSNQTIGPRQELKKEFFDETKQKFLMYRTDRFLEYYSQMYNKPVNENVLEEIRDVTSKRVATKTVITLSEDIINEEDSFQEGYLTVELQKDAYSFTCSGHISVYFPFAPTINVKLIDSPDNCPKDINTGSGTGTTFDFHIHVRSNELNIPLPSGIYKFKYTLYPF